MKKKILAVSAIFILGIFILSGCGNEKNTELFESKGGDFSVVMDSSYEEDKIEETESPKGIVYSYKRGNETLNISEFIIPGVTLDEKMIEEEIGMATDMEVLRPDSIDLKENGKFYGVLVKDNSTGMYMMYHRIQKGDKIVSFLSFSPDPYTVENEAEYKAMISTIKFK